MTPPVYSAVVLPPDPYDDPLRGVRTLLVSMVVVLVAGTALLTFFDTDEADSTEATTATANATTDDSPEGVDTTGASVVDDGSTAATDATTASTATTSAASDRIVTLPDDPLQGLAVEVVATDLSQPTFVVTAPGDDRLFVTERVGRIQVIDSNGVLDTSWMNITDKVRAGGIEQGLLGLAFHPDYPTNGRFFAYYVNKDGQRTLSEFSGHFIEGDAGSEKVLFSLPQPFDDLELQRHYGGMVQFGPDGLLFVSVGDGADARGQGQNPDSFFATILRLDVDNGDPYAVPADNPFVDGGGAPEVFAFGLRNPWRYWIDPFDNDMYIADVGQGDWEEIDVISITDGGGGNLGWANMEGTHCFFESNCDINDYVAPVLEYTHGDPPDGECSVTGGPVYRGGAMPELDGHYFYADWCAGWVRSFAYVDGALTDERDWQSDLGIITQINGIGTDANGEMIIVTFDGRVLRLVPVR